jgi:hypothetical protein
MLGGGREKFGPWLLVSTNGVRSDAWNTGWIFHWSGSINWYTTGDMTLDIRKGPCLLGVSLTVPYGSARFFASSQTICPCFHLASGVGLLLAVLFRASMAKALLFHNDSANCSAVWLLDDSACYGVILSSHPISS